MIVDIGIPLLNEYHVDSVLPFFPDIVPLLVNVGDKSFFQFLTECRSIINMGMPHLNPLERERLACLLVRSQYVKDMPQKLSFQLCRVICIYIKFAIHLLCFLPLFPI